MNINRAILKIVKRIFKLESYPVYLKYFQPHKNLNLIDIGAYKGQFTNYLLNYLIFDTVIFVEPIAENMSFLRKKFSKPNFKFEQCVVSDMSNEKINFNVNTLDYTSSVLQFNSIEEIQKLDQTKQRTIYVNVTTLKEIIQKYELDTVFFVKIDVQGIEDKVIDGAGDYINKINFIWVETSFKELYKESCMFDTLYKKLVSKGFVLLEISPGYRSEIGELLQTDLLFANKSYISQYPNYCELMNKKYSNS